MILADGFCDADWLDGRPALSTPFLTLMPNMRSKNDNDSRLRPFFFMILNPCARLGARLALR